MFFKRIQEDLAAFMLRDPAARSRLVVFLCYPGFHALLYYRLSHGLWRRDWHLLGRFVSQFGRFLTGIEIHPGAEIGHRFVIDHGSGAVIGETSEIGDDVTMYHGVTLGGVAPSVDSSSQVNQKRHPTIKNSAIIGSGAQILGPIVIGEGARIGSNAVVTKDVPPGVSAVGIPARIIMPRDKTKAKEFAAYGTTSDGAPDPITHAIEALRGQIAELMARVNELESEARGREGGSDEPPAAAAGTDS
jgi:serine O-acetyltransferase